MSALTTLLNISSTPLVDSCLKYCFVSADKKPFKIDRSLARPNCKDDFVDFEELVQSDVIDEFEGVGISIQASNICAIDVDHCFERAFDVSSADNRATDILSRFKKYAYCEFSFSGTGLRILFKHELIQDYSQKYYIKNSKHQIEYYEPANSFRYVTLTGRSIYDNSIIDLSDFDIVEDFLEAYMVREKRQSKVILTDEKETRTYEELMRLVKRFYLKNVHFQDLWFKAAPGSGKNESELDFELLSTLYENITRDRDLLKQIFESSPYFKSKDFKHISKWNKNDFRYFNYVFGNIVDSHL